MGDTTEPVLKLRSSDLASRSFQDETIVLDLRSSTYLSANPAAALLWQELAAGATRTRLIAALLEEFDVNDERAARDVDAFVEQCRERGLLAS